GAIVGALAGREFEESVIAAFKRLASGIISVVDAIRARLPAFLGGTAPAAHAPGGAGRSFELPGDSTSTSEERTPPTDEKRPAWDSEAIRKAREELSKLEL